MTALLRRAARGASGLGLIRRGVLLLAAVSLAGCSLLNPHVTPESWPTHKLGGGTPKFAGGAAEAIDRANDWIDTYYEAVGDQSKLRAGVALITVPATAAALYFGISGDAGRDVITGLAVGTASVLGIGTIFESSDRQRVWLAGGEAIGCVILASRSLLVPADEFAALQSSTADLGAAIDNANIALFNAKAAADALRARKSNHPMLALADQQTSAATQLIAASTTTAGQAAGFIGRINTAGVEIDQRVRNITLKVSDEITRTEPDIASIKQILGELSGTAARFTPPEPKPVTKPATTPDVIKAASGASDEETQLVNNLDAALTALRDASDKLLAADSKVRTMLLTQSGKALPVVAGDQDKTDTDIAACNLAPSEIGIQLNPADTDKSLKAGDQYVFNLSGGKRPYSIVLSEGHPDGVQLLRGASDQPVVITVATDKAKTTPGTFSVVISDATDQPIQINFTVTPAAGGSGGGNANNSGGGAVTNNSGGGAVTNNNTGGAGTNNSGGGAVTNTNGGTGNTSTAAPGITLSPYEATLSQDKIRIAQFGAGTAIAQVDGVIGNNTRVQFKGYQIDHNKTPADGALDPVLYQELKANADKKWSELAPKMKCPIPGSMNAYECTELDSGDFVVLQQKNLKIDPPTGKFDDKTRAAIAGFSAPLGDRPTDPQQLSPTLVEDIRKATP